MQPKWLKPVIYLGALWYAIGLVRFFLRFTLDNDGVVLELPLFILILLAVSAIAGFLATQLIGDEPRDAFVAFALSLGCSLCAFGWVLATAGVDFQSPFSTIILPITIIAVSTFYTWLSRWLHRRKIENSDQSNE